MPAMPGVYEPAIDASDGSKVEDALSGEARRPLLWDVGSTGLVAVVGEFGAELNARFAAEVGRPRAEADGSR